MDHRQREKEAFLLLFCLQPRAGGGGGEILNSPLFHYFTHKKVKQKEFFFIACIFFASFNQLFHFFFLKFVYYTQVFFGFVFLSFSFAMFFHLKNAFYNYVSELISSFFPFNFPSLDSRASHEMTFSDDFHAFTDAKKLSIKFSPRNFSKLFFRKENQKLLKIKTRRIFEFFTLLVVGEFFFNYNLSYF